MKKSALKRFTLFLAAVMLVLIAVIMVACDEASTSQNGDTDAHVHSFGEWQTVSATCTEDGKYERICEDGDDSEIIVISKTGHHYVFGACIYCNEAEPGYQAPSIDGHIHNYGDWTMTAATCTEDGKYERTCKDCRYTETLPLPSTGHNYISGRCIDCNTKDTAFSDFEFSPYGDGYEVVAYLGTDEDVVIPDEYEGRPVVSIGEFAFVYTSNVKTLTIPPSIKNAEYPWNTDGGIVERIYISNLKAWCEMYGNYLPFYLKNVENGLYLNGEPLRGHIEIPEGTSRIGSYAFYSCSALTSITISNSVTSIGSYAFSGCTGLTSVTIGNSVTSIGSYAFSGCTGLTEIIIPDSVISLHGEAFSRCSNLGSIHIGSGVVNLPVYDMGIFYGLSLKSITVSEDNPKYMSKDGILYDKVEKSIVLVFNVEGDISILDGVTSIGNSAFSGCSNLTSVTIPDSVTSIGSDAFRGCTGLTSITIPNSVTSIGSDAFRGCTGLTSVTFENTTGWFVSNPFSATSVPTPVGSGDLANEVTAATYLRSTYVDYNWKREDV